MTIDGMDVQALTPPPEAKPVVSAHAACSHVGHLFRARRLRLDRARPRLGHSEEFSTRRDPKNSGISGGPEW